MIMDFRLSQRKTDDKKRTDVESNCRVVRKWTDLTDIPDMIYNM